MRGLYICEEGKEEGERERYIFSSSVMGSQLTMPETEKLRSSNKDYYSSQEAKWQHNQVKGMKIINSGEDKSWGGVGLCCVSCKLVYLIESSNVIYDHP